jgi:hypothetical protein
VHISLKMDFFIIDIIDMVMRIFMLNALIEMNELLNEQ